MQLLLKCTCCLICHLICHGHHCSTRSVRCPPFRCPPFDALYSTPFILGRFTGQHHLRLTIVSHTYFTCLTVRTLEICIFHLFLVAKDGACTHAAPACIHALCRMVNGSESHLVSRSTCRLRDDFMIRPPADTK